MKYARLLLSVFIFVLDVRVKAHVIDAPTKCANTSGVCAILNDSGVLKRAASWGEVRLAEGASYITVSDNEIRLLRGKFLVESHDAVKVSTLYGDFKLKSGKAYFEVKDLMVSFTNISTNFEYQPLGDSQFYNLPPGFMNYLARVKSNGIADVGYPRLAELKPLIKGWAGLVGASEVPSLRADFAEFSDHWSKAQKVVGPWYAETVAREIASEKAEEERLARLREQQKIESEKWRRMFRSRNYLGVDPGDTHD